MFEQHTVALSTGDQAYWVAGEGKPLLYLHAAGGAMQTPFLKRLAETRRVYMPVAPGFDGQGRHDAVATVSALADLAAEFIGTVIGEEPVDVMGASFGGWAALWLAARHPACVHYLVVEAPAGLSFGAQPLSPEATRMALFAYPERAKAFAPAPEAAKANGQAYGDYSQGALVDEALKAAVADISARTLILMGFKDVIVPPETGWFLARTVPKAHLSYVYDAAHGLEVDQPDATLRTVTAFLDRGAAFVVASAPLAA